MNKYLPLFSAFATTLLIFFTIAFTTQAQSPESPSLPPLPREVGGIRSSPAITHTLYLPLVSTSYTDPCAAIPNQTYNTVAITPPPTDRPADQHADLNLGMRGYTATNAAKNLVDIDGPTDPNAPQLKGLFSPVRLPTFTSTYEVGDWNWGCNCWSRWITDPVVSLVGMGTGLAEIISTPAYPPGIGFRPADGYAVMVLYATTQRITLKYTRDDNVVSGYTLHAENICVEPSLLALYNTWNAPAQGRSRLPALNAAQPFGRAKKNEILVSIRDTGSFMDPRSRKDWWQGY